MLDIAGSAAAGNLIVGLSLSTSTLIQTYGNEWTQVADTGMRDSRWRAIEFMDTSQAVALLERRLPAGTDSGSLYLTRDGGTTWAPIAFGTSLLPPACHSSSLSLMQPASSLAALGNFTVTLVLKNQGPGSCTLEGYPNLALYGSSGAALPIKVTHSPDSYIVTRRTIEPVVLTPGGVASFFISGSNGGPSCQVAVRVAIQMPGAVQGVSGPVQFQPCDGAVEVSPVVTGRQSPHL
jgi:hypothetical protein